MTYATIPCLTSENVKPFNENISQNLERQVWYTATNHWIRDT